MSTPKRFTLVGAGLVAGALLFGATTALAQSTGGNGGRGGNGGATAGASAGTGGGAPVIVCTGCADPNSYIERGGGGTGGGAYSGKGGGGPGKVTSVKPIRPVKPVRPRAPRTRLSETDPCYRTYDYLPNGAVVVYRKCNGVVRPLR
ncbi:hypothetical protein [Amorphus orientalis]|uniref:Uncharacterized protein n=1 Tax=Amorphus orientalis TaxID=649198 RepID=A0AAE4AU73_9HYPH|nr:hypothetical protein [Amorphus orientalis]MDQ0315644.1 hypothetical protein [Amorphus orientalis]